MRKSHSLFAVLALSGVAAGAQAQIKMTTTDRISGGYGINFIFNSAPGSTSYAGPFQTTVTGSGFAFNNFDAYCVDLAHYLQPTETITPQDIKTAFPTSGAQLAYLYDTFAGGVGNDAAKGAALQIALWEVKYDYTGLGNNGIDLNAGAFQFTSAAVDDIYKTKYNSIKGFLTNGSHTGYLDNLPSSFSSTASYLESAHPTGNTGQSLIGPASVEKSLIAAANVPEPGMVSLTASSLVGMSVFGLRRRRRV